MGAAITAVIAPPIAPIGAAIGALASAHYSKPEHVLQRALCFLLSMCCEAAETLRTAIVLSKTTRHTTADTGMRVLQIILTGHSLGGFCSAVLAHRFGLPFVIFNAPGDARLFLKQIDHCRKQNASSSLLSGISKWDRWCADIESLMEHMDGEDCAFFMKEDMKLVREKQRFHFLRQCDVVGTFGHVVNAEENKKLDEPPAQCVQVPVLSGHDQYPDPQTLYDLCRLNHGIREMDRDLHLQLESNVSQTSEIA